ncbi:hypothetical protein E4U46_006337 [Claviceps purpurea]|nr:hypothetical protein E4U46_006337 [Claviceps purpurea]
MGLRARPRKDPFSQTEPRPRAPRNVTATATATVTVTLTTVDGSTLGQSKKTGRAQFDINHFTITTEESAVSVPEAH